MKLVYIEWADAISSAGWKLKEDALKWAKEADWIVINVGWVIEETKEYICLSSSISEPSDEPPQYGQLHKIPKTWIRKRRVIKI